MGSNVNNMNKKTINKNNSNNKAISKKILIYIALLLIMIYVFYAVYLLIKQPTNKVSVEKATLYMEETDIGYIIRDEKVIKGNNYKNGMEQIKSEGEKTAKGASIFRYFSKNEEKVKEQIAELDNKVQEALEGQAGTLTSEAKISDAKILENQLDEKIELISKATDISKVDEYKKQIEDLITKKSKIYGEASGAGSYLKKLYNKRAKLEESVNSGAEYIKAPRSGIVSYKVDGLEDKLTPKDFSKINKDILNSFNLKTAQIVATSTESGKIIDSSSCYIATITDSKEAKQAKKKDKVYVRLANNKTIPATIAYKSTENENETLIVLEINEQIKELAEFRKISFDLIWWSAVGLKVPNQAIVNEKGLEYVVRNKAGYQEKILIKVKKSNEKYSIVSTYDAEEMKDLKLTKEQINNVKTISIYDELLLEPDLNKIN